MHSSRILPDKCKEAAASVLPITCIVCLLCFIFVPVDASVLLCFLLGAALLIAGMGLFTLGAEMSMTRIGTLMGAKLTKSRNLPAILCLCFLLGVAVTVAEPDLQVLAANVPGVSKSALILAVSAGVGLFLMLSMARILLRVPLHALLIVCYALVFTGAYFCAPSMLCVAFDAGGVTTGPMTVPFIMALGVGVASIRSDENAKADSFGLVALCSVGPVLAVMALSLLSPAGNGAGQTYAAADAADTVALGWGYLRAFPAYLLEVAVALAPIAVFFVLFQILSLRMRRIPLARILVGFGYTYAGLVLFLTGANVGLSPMGYVLGSALAQEGPALFLPLAVLMGWFIIRAEPAVHILNRQVEELSAGAISQRAMGLSLSVAVAAATGLAMVRVVTGIPILYLLVPGYAVALGLSFFVPRTFTAIAFDAGGVASGPLTATFLLPLAVGACGAVGGEVLTDAFGLVALVAMTPLITVQVMGAVSVFAARRRPEPAPAPVFGENQIIELWEAC